MRFPTPLLLLLIAISSSVNAAECQTSDGITCAENCPSDYDDSVGFLKLSHLISIRMLIMRATVLS